MHTATTVEPVERGVRASTRAPIAVTKPPKYGIGGLRVADPDEQLMRSGLETSESLDWMDNSYP
jgi:hypothetical protein